ncbi:hypothetical protein GQ42DRAFT_164559 [Ramicandelaber brevisporus]|nr:hypothetical protein GQ42DRAFT_164559 [Ramicandelaber brevisporus]
MATAQESSAHESLAMVTPAVARQAPLLTSAAPPKINSQITPFRINRPINKASIMSPVTTSASFTSNPGQIDVQFPSVQRCRQLSTFGDKKRIVRKKRAPLQFASLHEYCATYIQLLAEHVQVALDSLGVELRNVINRLSKDAAGGKGAGVAAPVTDEIVRRAGAMIGVRVYPDTVLKLKPATSATTNTAGSPSAATATATPVRISGRRSNSFTTSTSPSAHLNNGKHAVYSTVLIELPRKEPPVVATTFSKDDIWIITNSPTFDPSSTFVCRSAFFGISQTNHVELSFIGQRDLDIAEKMAQLSKRTSTNIKVSGNGNNNKRMMASMMDGGDDCDDMIGLIRTPGASSVGKWQQMEVIALRLADMSSDWTMIDKLVSLLSLSSDHNGPIADPPNVPSIIKALISPPSIPPIIPVSKSSVDIMAPLKKDGLDQRINQAILDCVYDRIIADGCREYQLNPEQEAAAARALRAFHSTTCRFFSSKYNNDSTTDGELNEPQAMLIHGPFGTGKSTLIAVVIILALRLATEIESHFQQQQQQQQQQKQKHTSSSESNANLSNDNDSDDEALEQMEYIHKRQAVLDKKDAQSARSRLRIMVTSFTNIAVDRVLHCLLDRGFDDFVRIGSVKRMSRRVLPYAIRSSVSSSSGRSVPSSSSATSATSTADNADIRDLEAMLKDPSTPASELPVIRQALQRFKASGHRDLASNAFLVCCTCLSSASEVINGLHFAATIIDEASQVPEPLALVPLTNISTDQLVLVGDPCQLPPMLTTISEFTNQMHIDNGSSNSIKHSNSNSNCGDEDGDNFSSKLTIPLPKGADGLDRTMFDRLAALNFPITQLRTQYRCHPSISLLSNSLFYSSQLHDGVDHSAREPLVMGLPPVVFLDIADGKESKPPGSKSFINKREVDVVGQLIECLTKKAGVESDKVGVISFYKGQADAIEARITGTDKESNKAGTGSGGVLKALKTISTPTVRRSAGLSRKKIKVDSTATATATATDNTTTTEEHDGEKQPQQHQQSHVRVSTVDAFQGDEFDIVILTTTRTDSIGFIDASNRVNVALSRARRHLIVTCNVDLLTTKSKLWRSVIEKTMPKEEATIGPVREARSFIADLNALQSQLPQPSSQRPSQPPSVVSELSDPGSDIVDNDINNDMENDDGDVEESHSLQTQSTSIQMPDFSHIPESVSDVEEYSPDDTDSRIRVDDEADDADADADADADTDESRGDVINIAPRLSTQVRRQRMIDTLLQSVVRRDIGTAIEARKRPAVFDEEDEDEEDEENEENAGEDDEKDDDDGGGVIWQSSKLDKESDEMDEDAEDEDDDENYEEGDSQLRFLEIEEY